MGVDVLIIVALPLEFNHLLEVRAGVEEAWQDAGDLEHPHHRARLAGERGPLEVAVVRLTKPGGIETATEATRLISRFEPKCLAMCGVCGGNPDDTVFGDVVIADRVVQHDEGKQTPEGFSGDLWTHPATKRWRHVAGGMDGKPAMDHHGYARANASASQWWLMEQLAEGRNPRAALDYGRYFPDSDRSAYMTQIERELKLVRRESGKFMLTPEGQAAWQDYLLDRPTQITELPYHIRVGVMGSGNAVQADGEFWKRMKKGGVRKAMAVDMEAFAVGHVATDHNLPFIVIKGVMDYAHPDKNDAYKPFAARASAEVLCSFLRKVCEPAPADASASRAKKVAKKPAKKATRKASEPPRTAAAKSPAGDSAGSQSPAGDFDGQPGVDLDSVRAAISAQLERDADTRRALTSALRAPDQDDLVETMLASDDVLGLVESFHTALRPLQPGRSEHKRVARSLRAIFDVVVPAIAGPRTRVRVGSGDRLETNARHVRGLDAAMATRRGDKKLDFQRLPGQRAMPRHGYDLAHPEAGMDDREHAFVIGSDLAKRFGEPLAARIAKLCRGMVEHRAVEPGVLAYHDIDERLLNVANALRAHPEFYVLALEQDHELAHVLRDCLPLSVVFSIKDETWEYHTNLGWRICDVYDEYFRINPEEASR